MIRPRALVRPWKRRRTCFALRAFANRPKLLPSMTIVSKRPSASSMSSIESTRASLTPRRRHASTAPGRHINGHDVLLTSLKVKGDPPPATADVEDAAPRESHRQAMVRRPAPEGGKVERWSRATRVNEAIIALDDLDRIITLKSRQEHVAVGVRLFADASQWFERMVTDRVREA